MKTSNTRRICVASGLLFLACPGCSGGVSKDAHGAPVEESGGNGSQATTGSPTGGRDVSPPVTAGDSGSPGSATTDGGGAQGATGGLASGGMAGAGGSAGSGGIAATGGALSGGSRLQGGSTPTPQGGVDAVSGASAGGAGATSSGGNSGGSSAEVQAGGIGGLGGASCAPEARWCDGNTPVYCDDSGTPQPDAACGGTTPWCRDGTCVGCPSSGGPAMVPVSRFCIDSTEVTQAQYQSWLSSSPSLTVQPEECSWNTEFMPASQCTMSSTVCIWETGMCDEAPQVCVDWCDAWAYCQAVGKRLCGAISGGSVPYDDASAGQWRAACGDVYPYGDTYETDACNPAGTSVAGTTDVGSLPGCTALHGGLAVYDLSGNATEWEDACSARNGAADTCHARGGGFGDSAAELTCEALPNPPRRRDEAAPDLGFRCCSL